MKNNLIKQEVKIIAKTKKFRTKLIKILDSAKIGKNLNNNEYDYLMVCSVSDLIKYTDLIISDKFKDAADYDMDSSVRDIIPEDIFDFVQEKAYPPNDKITIHEAFQDKRLFKKQKLNFTTWKNEILNLLVVQKFACNKQKAKHYIEEADSVPDANMNLKGHYRRNTTPEQYIYLGEIEGFWMHNE